MKGRILTAAVVGSGALAAASLLNVWWEMSKRSASANASVAPPVAALKTGTAPASSAVAGGDSAAAAGKVSQLLELEKISPDDPVAGSKRRAILMEWFQQDFAGALAYCKALGYEDLKDADVSRYVAKTASVDQLADIIGTAPAPFEITHALCEGAGLEKVKQLMLTGDRYTGDAAKGFAGGVSAFLAGKNIDSAILFAESRASDELRSAALAGVVDQLASEGKNSEVQFLYDALDKKLRDTDSVKFAYGKSLHDADPETAITTLYSIQDPAMKQLALLSFARKMESNQPALAVSAIQASGLSPEAQERHLERILGDWVALDQESANAYLATAESLSPELRARLQTRKK